MDASRRSLRLEIGEFARLAIDRRTAEVGAFLREAALYYLSDVDSGRPATRRPALASGAAEQEMTIELALPERHWRALEHEAAQQEITLERLLEHALLLYLADLDSGRAVRRLAQSGH